MLDPNLLKELKDFVERNLEVVPLESPSVHTSYHLVENQTELVDFIEKHRNPSFQQTLFHYIDVSGATDPEIYKKAGIDRRLFSKLRSNPDYHPGKSTVIALALALELNKEDTTELLHTAGYTLSQSDLFDLIIEFCIEKKMYNIHEVNLALDQFQLKPLL